MRNCTEHTFTAPDGQELFYRAWKPSTEWKRAVILFHRGHEHSGRLQMVVDGLQLEDYAFFAWDQRGCGHSPGERGHARNLAQLESDMQAFLDHLQLDPEQVVVVAHSVAAVVAGLWALDYAPRLRGLVLATPALQVKLYVPFARPALALARSLGLMENVQSYVRGGALTHDKEQARAYDQDPLISKQIATDLLLDLYKGSRRLLKWAGHLETPTLVLSARADWVVKNQPIRALFRRLPSPHKEVEVYKDFYHGLFYEKERHRVFSDIRSFILRCFERPVERAHLVNADRYGDSAERYRWHKAGPPWLSPANWVYTKMRLAMGTLGRLSQGIRLGYKSGFSSGSTLDYVYQNQARGITPLGKLIDRVYLEAIGWRCIRQRRVHMQQILREIWPSQGRVADIAGGPGRYLLEILKPGPEVIVRDRDVRGLEEGRQLSGGAITYQQGDAFDTASVASLGPLDVGIVSGLYELFPDNAPLRASLAGLATAIKTGGYLVYTNQPYHPQLELIAQTLRHGDGSPWVMRCRSTAEMDELVRQAGFRKIKMLIDDEGIFSVSLAQRLP
jgi:alpha-beta hydrolase superfamily lysophospholipase